MIHMIPILLAMLFCAGCCHPSAMSNCPLKSEQEFVLRAKKVATASPECADILARFPAILEHPQILPSQAPTISVRFDHTDVKTLQILGSIVVNMTTGEGATAADRIEVRTFPLRVQ
jgi:hypothetical protein